MNNINRRILIIIIVAMVAILGGLGIYKYKSVQTYNGLIKTANEYMEKGKYDQSVELLQESLSYKNDDKVKDSIELAKKLKEASAIYNQGLKLMDEKKYLEAINEFEKITKEDDKIYEEANKKIEECRKVYEALDKKNNKEDEDKPSKNITPDNACDIIKKYVKSDNGNINFRYDHDETKKGVQYYVIQAFEDHSDHITTIGWYYVDKNTGKAYELDVVSNSLVPLK